MSDVTPPPTDDEPSLVDRLRGTGVGVEDETIVGDAGLADVAPEADPDDAEVGDEPGTIPLETGDEPGEV